MSRAKNHLQLLQFLQRTSSITIPIRSKILVRSLSEIVPVSYFHERAAFDEYSLCNALKNATFESCNTGKQIQAVIIKDGFHKFTILMTALMNFNLKCGNLRDARGVFDEMSERDVVTWTSMIVGYVQNKHFDASLRLFKKMIEFDVIPNGYSFSGALSACSGLQDVKLGKQVHAHVLISGVLDGNVVLQNSLLNMYSRCKCLASGRNLFDLMMVKDMIAWNEMMSSYLQCEQGEEALKLFASMVSQGLKPDKFSYSVSVDACASLVSIPQGDQVHGCILKTGFQSDLIIRSSLVNMYAKCGCVDSAKLVFDAMPTKDTLLWTTMISAYGRNGQVEEVLAMFEKMLELKINPDGITYLAVLSSCSHGGMVEKGWKYFRLMTEDNLVSAGPEHYSCMVDLLCRSGLLLEALEFIKDIPSRPSISVWCSFLSSCKLYGDIELAQFASDKILELNPQNTSSFVVLSNMHAAEFGWDETEKIRKTMKNDHVKKEPGCSWVELKNGVHVFLTSDKSHPEVCEILFAVKSLMSKGWIDEEHDLMNC
ncbi:pentatricopeptide repeat-containing protein At2g13600-like [Papaver somniferum]|uniref:pentatricopeptide repeat-containing protein At2g13600-like n=1 Tax=Papaver somniferum TaxID=3469 RepID=UPI000E704909|nr:pentatricopeptide repeat-containing protein At2g13600-like [Papaver somniferum]